MTKVTFSDFIHDRDDDFYNFLKNFIGILHEKDKKSGKENWELWGIPRAKMNRLDSLWSEYEKLYDKAQAKKNRRASDVDAHRQARKGLEKFLREFVNQYIRYEDQVPRSEKIRMGVIPRDTEPSPVHGTSSPFVDLKNLGGAMIDIRCRRTTDETRCSMLKGYIIEMRYIASDAAPLTPDEKGMKTEISSKSHFPFDAGMSNLKKTLYCYFRWRHKSNPAYNSPWTNLMQITIA